MILKGKTSISNRKQEKKQDSETFQMYFVMYRMHFNI